MSKEAKQLLLYFDVFSSVVHFGQNKLRHSLIIYLVFLLVAGACANIGAPTGGPRDTTPPVVLYSEPPNSSVNFSGTQIRIFFDEFIELRGLSQKLFISPPLEIRPDIRVRGRSVVIDLQEELRENTTYSFFFGDAIVDFNESNAIPGFTFVVATGPYVDSLSISGNVVEAFSLKPAEGVLVMLYDNFADSAPMTEFPSYVALTDKSGNYTISNIRKGEFKIFALRDKNSNFKFDLPNEAIGFLDSLVVPSYAASLTPKGAPETAKEPENGQDEQQAAIAVEAGEEPVEEIEPQIDTTTVEAGKEAVPKYNLVLFVEADTVQRITAGPIDNGVVRFFFKQPFQSLTLRDLTGQLPEKWKYTEPSQNRDTLSLYLIPPIKDSIHVEIADKGVIADTLKVATRPRVARTRDATRTQDDRIDLQLNIDRARNLHYFDNLRVSSASLIETFDSSLLRMISVEDSLFVETTFIIDSILPRHLILKTPLEKGSDYHLEIFAGAITDVFGNTNDTVVANFSITRPQDYSSLMTVLEVEDPVGSYVLQLIGGNNAILQEKVIPGAGSYSFKHLQAGTYGLRLIDDLNGNRKWDTGNYLKRIQPEPVYLFPDQILIRENWEAEMSWVVKK